MIHAYFPLAKLGTLLLKQISKPLANVIRHQAKTSPIFRRCVCQPPAHAYNWCEIKLKMWILNLGRPVNVPVLNESMAIELGANLLTELIIFFTAAGVIISEYNRQTNKEMAKEEAKKQEMTDLQNTIRELFIQTEEQSAQLRELTRKLGAIETKFGPYSPSPRKSDSPSSPQHPPPSPQKPLPSPLPTPQSPKKSIEIKEKDQGYVLYSDKSDAGPNILHSKMCKEKPKSRPQHTSIILRAVDEIEHQFWDYPLIERQEDGYLFLSLYYVQQLLRLRV